MQSSRYSIADVLPHRAPMILLDELLDYDYVTAVAATAIRDTTLFLEPEGVPAHIGLEYMAQTCGAHAGALALDQGQPVRIGLLLGTREYRTYVPYFRLGECLTISVKIIYRDDEMGAFACRITIDATLAAEAQLTVYRPDHIEALADERGT